MKNVFVIVLFLLMISRVASAQFNISTNYMAEFLWDDEKKEWVIQREDKKSTSFFELNDNLTMLKHTTTDVTSNFKIKHEEHNNDGGNAYYMLNIVSDLGRDFFLIFDFKEGTIKVTPANKSFMVLYRIKGTWSE